MTGVDTRRDGAVFEIVLDRPEALNALDAAAHAALAAALEQARDADVRAVVLTGAGRGFCVGQDLRELSGAGEVAQLLRERFNRHALAIRALEKPVIAAVNGVAAGAGLSLALACDVRIASDAATFVPAFGRIGLAPDAGGTWFARRLLGAGRAFEWFATGRTLTAAEALQWGVVSEVVPAAAFAERVHEVAELFASLPTRALAETKRLLDAAESSTLAVQLETEACAQEGLVRTPDFTEGAAAFAGKRDPAFTGAAEERLHPVQLVVHDDLRRWRLTASLRWLLAVPHLFVVGLWTYLVVPVAVVAWAITLVRGRTPRALHDWLARFLRYWTHVQAYTWLVADPFPGFRGWYGTYPIDLDVEPPGAQSRWKTLLRLPLAIPAYVLLLVLGTVLEVVAIVAWFPAVAVARVPRGMRDLMAYSLRYNAQTYAYLLFLTDRYPTLASRGGFQFEEG